MPRTFNTISKNRALKVLLLTGMMIAPLFGSVAAADDSDDDALPVTPASYRLDLTKIDTGLKPFQRIGKPYKVAGLTYVPAHEPDYDQTAPASWYSDKFENQTTANGEKYDPNALTAAHKTLPLGSLVRVTNLANGKSLTLRINDRGPFAGMRIINLSKRAANALGREGHGLGRIRVQYAGAAAKNPELDAHEHQGGKAVTRAAENVIKLETKPEAEIDSGAVSEAGNMAPAIRLPKIPPPIPTSGADSKSLKPYQVVTLTIKGPIHMATHEESVLETPASASPEE